MPGWNQTGYETFSALAVQVRPYLPGGRSAYLSARFAFGAHHGAWPFAGAPVGIG